MEQEKPHVLGIKAQIIILIALIVLTFMAIGVTKIELGHLALPAVLIIAAVQAYIVMAYHMHLKFEVPFFRIMVIALLVLFLAVLLVTFLDYIYR
jgi:cytochrome c oxidase subunit IV